MLWLDTIMKEMKHMHPAFKPWDSSSELTETHAALKYSSVVSRDSVRLVLLMAALNDVPLLAADIGNAYLNATCREKIYTTAGAEFGDLQGKVLIIERALYGLKSSGGIP